MEQNLDTAFDVHCKRCSRLAAHLASIRATYSHYHALPVAPFGDDNPGLLIVGLAPGLHGANATGRPFTGDYAGILLYQTLYKYGFSNQPEATDKNDGLQLSNCRITNAVKCLPPANKPTSEEIRNCNQYLAAEINAIKGDLIILTLGRIAHEATLKALQLKARDYRFGHGVIHSPATGRWLINSYHCSRYNTNTGRLTEKMFHEVFDKIHELINITD